MAPTALARDTSRETRFTRKLRIRLGKHFKWPPPVSGSARTPSPILVDLDPRADAHYGSIIFHLLWSPNWRSLTARNCGQVVFEVALPVAAVSAAAAISGWIDMSASCHRHTHTQTHTHTYT